MNLLRVKDVAELFDITERTIWNKIRRGELPTITVAGITRIDGDKLQTLIEAQSPPSSSTNVHRYNTGRQKAPVRKNQKVTV